MTVASGGAGDITLGTAVDGYQTFADAGVSDTDVIRYTIEDGVAWEIGTGVYTASGTTLVRTVTESSNSDTALTCSADAVIFVTLAAEDFSGNAAPSFSNTIPDTLELAAGTTSTINAKALDDDGFPITYSFDAFSGNTVYSASSIPPQFTSITVDQTTGVFSLAATSSASGGGSVNLRVRASDGVRIATKKVFCNLSFLPLSGLKGLYDMKDSSSYSGTGANWYDISGNSGPTLSIIQTSDATYNSSGIGGIPQLDITGTTNTAIVSSPNPFLTYDATTLKTTVCMIFAKVPEAGWLAQGSYVFPVSTGTSGSLGSTGSSTLIAANSTANALQVGTGSAQAGVASSTSKVYIDKVDQTSISEQGLKDAIGDANNREIYHSIVVTDAWYNNGFFWNNVASYTALGSLRALVFYDRALTQAEVTGLHAHFAGDYTSSEMIQ